MRAWPEIASASSASAIAKNRVWTTWTAASCWVPSAVASKTRRISAARRAALRTTSHPEVLADDHTPVPLGQQTGPVPGGRAEGDDEDDGRHARLGDDAADRGPRDPEVQPVDEDRVEDDVRSESAAGDPERSRRVLQSARPAGPRDDEQHERQAPPRDRQVREGGGRDLGPGAEYYDDRTQQRQPDQQQETGDPTDSHIPSNPALTAPRMSPVPMRFATRGVVA